MNSVPQCTYFLAIKKVLHLFLNYNYFHQYDLAHKHGSKKHEDIKAKTQLHGLIGVEQLMSMSKCFSLFSMIKLISGYTQRFLCDCLGYAKTCQHMYPIFTPFVVVLIIFHITVCLFLFIS